MRAWGPGNFDNEPAQQYLGDLVEHLTTTVEQHLLHESGDVEAFGEAEVMPSVEVLLLLAEQLRGVPPVEGRVVEWKAEYLRRYDAQAEQSRAHRPLLARRRAVIVATFDRLAALASAFHQADSAEEQPLVR